MLVVLTTCTMFINIHMIQCISDITNMILVIMSKDVMFIIMSIVDTVYYIYYHTKKTLKYHANAV